jgi:hypothetical protein
MEDYKVRYKKNGIEKVTDWLDKATAERKFKKLSNEKELVTEWAELLMYDDTTENMVVLKSFDRKAVEIFGHTLIIN